MSDEQQHAADNTGIHVTIARDGATLTSALITVHAHQGDIYQAHPWQPRWEPSAADAHALLDAMPCDYVPAITPLPSGSRMPFAPNPHFVGRDQTLLTLAVFLHGSARVAIGPKAAATGLGGIGKTSVAVEVVHRYGSFFAGGVFWLSFADPAAIPSEIAACGGPGLLDLHPTYGTLKQDEQLALMRQAWHKPIPRLLIFDNCEDPQLVQQWAPTSGGCRVLITSRRQTWSSGFEIAALSLDVLARPASVALLRDLAPRLTEAEADDLAEELGDFPLALQLAGSYLVQFGRISAASYLAALQSDVILAHPSLRGVHDGDVSMTAHDRHVGRTFLVSYQRLDPARDVLAIALLARAACLAPGTPIALDLLLASADLAGDDATGLIALGRLVDLGFVTLEDEDVVLHRLVHAFVGAVVHDEVTLASVERALIIRAFTINAAGYPAEMLPLLGHLAWATRTMEKRSDVGMARLCTVLGNCYSAFGNYAQALPLSKRALVTHEQTLGANHLDTATSMENLAALLRITGDYRAAWPLLEQALSIRKQTLGVSHPQTATSLNGLAGLYYVTGDYASARSLYEQALAIHEQTLGAQHPEIATSLNNLAELLRVMGDYGAARPLLERGLAIREQTLGANHPETATSLNSLAGLHYATRAYGAARPLLERVLMIYEAALGDTHPYTATSLNNLAELLRITGDYGAAQPLLERGLAIREQTLGASHPETAMSLNNLAALHYSMGEYVAARPLLERALTIHEQALGAGHPETAASLNNLAVLHYSIGNYRMAQMLHEQALAIYEQTLGPHHPTTQMIQANLLILQSATETLNNDFLRPTR